MPRFLPLLALFAPTLAQASAFTADTLWVTVQYGGIVSIELARDAAGVPSATAVRTFTTAPTLSGGASPGVDFYDGLLYYASSDGRIYEVQADGTATVYASGLPASTSSLVGVKFDADGWLLAASYSPAALYRLPPGGGSGPWTAALASPEVAGVHNADPDPVTGDVFVADYGANRVRTYAPATDTLTGSVSLAEPTGILGGCDGLAYVSQHFRGTVAVVDTAAGTSRTLLSGLSYPEGLAKDAYGWMYVVQNNGAVVRFDAAGNRAVLAYIGADADQVVWYGGGTGTSFEAACGTADPDADGDGVPDDTDACPGGDDTVDTDGDGVPDACDTCPADFFNDSDGDGTCDGADPCPLDALDDADADGLCADAEGPGCAEDPDNDLDGDGVCAPADACPADPWNDADGDGTCGDVDACDDLADADGDGTGDACDACPLDLYNDSDGDGACDTDDPCPLDAADDSDWDGACDTDDLCPLDPDDDLDADGVCADVDACPADLLNDADGDGLCESDDNCPGVGNTDQSDLDADGTGDACEPDADADGVIDDDDVCPTAADPDQADADADGQGDVCDTDDDADGVNDAADRCAGTPPGAPASTTGCSIDQTCPTTSAWKNHGAYVSCVSHAATTLVREGVIGTGERDELVTAAADSDVGRR